MYRINVLPLVSADFTINFLVENTRVKIRFMWDTLIEYWVVNEYLEPDTGKRFTGVKVIPQYPITENVPTTLQGALMVGKTNNNMGTYINYDDFGNGWDLFYLSPTEYAEWKVLSGL